MSSLVSDARLDSRHSKVVAFTNGQFYRFNRRQFWSFGQNFEPRYVHSMRRHDSSMAIEAETAPARAAVGTPALSLTGASKTFGPVIALADGTIEIMPGEIHALVGEN